MWLCPICRSPLSSRQRTWVCDKQHTFDMAKQGYVNLLPVQLKKSKAPGDSKMMLQARQRFLASGAYEPLVNAIASALQNTPEIVALNPQSAENTVEPTQQFDAACASESKPQGISLFEAGCGEGYYTRELAKRLPACDIITGNDISKDAVLLAAKQGRQLITDSTILKSQFVVGNSFALPVADNSVDIVLQIFAPAADEELFRILAPQGVLIEVQPNTQHLQELKAKLFAHAEPHLPKMKSIGKTVHQTFCQYTLPLSPELTEDLILMTPLAFSSIQEKKSQAITTLTEVTVDFCITLYQMTHQEATASPVATLQDDN